MASPLRSLIALFDVGVNTSQIKKADKEIDGLKQRLDNVGKAFKAFIGYEVLKQVASFVEGTVEAGSQLKVMAERLGTGTDQLQALQLAAGEAGVGVEAMNTGLRFLNRNLGQAAHKGGPAAEAFRRLKIDLKDAHGVAKPAGDVMIELADAIAATPEPAKKTELAMRLLGRGGAELIPILNKGGQAFRDAREDMNALGGGMSMDFVEASRKAAAATARLSFAWTSVKTQIVGSILPGFEDFVRGLTHMAAGAADFEKKSHIFEDAFAAGKIALVVGGILKVVGAIEAMTEAEALALLANPIAWLVVGFVAALFAYNDLKVALEGGKSIFGDYFGQSGIESLNEYLGQAEDLIDEVITGFKVLFSLSLALSNQMDASLGRALNISSGGLLGTSKEESARSASDAQGQFDAALGQTAGLDARIAERKKRRAETPVGAKKRAQDILDWENREGRDAANPTAPALPWSGMVPDNYGKGAAASQPWVGMAPPTLPFNMETNANLTPRDWTSTFNMEFHGPAEPAAVKKAVQDGYKSAMERANSQTNVNSKSS